MSFSVAVSIKVGGEEIEKPLPIVTLHFLGLKFQILFPEVS